MSKRIEIRSLGQDESQHKFSKNEKFAVKQAGVDIGADSQDGSNVSVDQVVTSGREVAGVTVDGVRTPILVPNEGSAVQSDYAENDPSADDYIKNKPDLSIYISDPDYTHTDNNFTDGYKGVIDGLDNALAGKVDKVAGKGLSDNNFTNAQKDKLTNLAEINGIGSNLTLDPETKILSANAQPITIDDEMSSSSTNAVQNKVITEALGDKVDKVTGKVLSDNNFSNADKDKLDGIDQGAEVNDISTISVNGTQVTPSIGKNVDITVPTNVSDLTNDSGFITNTVNNLVNYYLKSETYTQSEVDSLISAIVTLDIKAVAALPTTDISTTTIYLVPSSDPGTQNIKDEYINITGDSTGWELIGSTEIDLTGYVTDTELTTALAGYVTTTAMSTALAAKLDISDVDQIYDPTSANPQSGAAVAEAIAGAGSGHIIEDSEGTELTQRDTIKVGGSLIAEDDSTNEKTIITDGMQTIDWQDWLEMTDEEKASVPKAVITNVPGLDSKLSVQFLKKLWENPSPSAAFAAQNITLSSSDYDFLMIEAKRIKSDTSYFSEIVEKGKSILLSASFGTSGGANNNFRVISYNSDTTLYVDNGYKATGATASTSDNDCIIPYQIYGFKASVDVDITAYMADLETDAKNVYLESGESVEDVLAWKKILPTNFIPSAVNTAVNQTFSELIGAEEIVVFIGQLQAHLYSVVDNPIYNTSAMAEVAKTNSPYEFTARIQWDVATGRITLTQTVKGTGAAFYAVERIIYR